MSQKNIFNKRLKLCSKNPITGYHRDGYCSTNEFDFGNHLVCAKMDKKFLDFTANQGNNLRSVVKEGDKWCICQDRYYEAYQSNKHPKIIKKATNKKIKPYVMKSLNKKKGGTKKMKNCCKITNKDKKCIRKDGKIFSLPRRFTKKRCKKGPIRGFTMRSSCAPFKKCK